MLLSRVTVVPIVDDSEDCIEGGMEALNSQLGTAKEASAAKLSTRVPSDINMDDFSGKSFWENKLHHSHLSLTTHLSTRLITALMGGNQRINLTQLDAMATTPAEIVQKTMHSLQQ